MAKSKASNAKPMQPVSKSGNQSRIDAIVRNPSVGLPKRFRTKLRFVDSGLIGVSGTIAIQGYGCNTPNTPSRTVNTTERPSYWAQLVELYDRCYVESSSIRVELVNVTVPDGIRVILSNDSNSSAPASANALAERVGAKEAMLGHYQGGSTTFRASHRWDPVTWLSVSPNSPDNTVVTGADPPDPYFWLVAAQSVGGGAGNLVYKIEVIYDIVFDELATL